MRHTLQGKALHWVPEHNFFFPSIPSLHIQHLDIFGKSKISNESNLLAPPDLNVRRNQGKFPARSIYARLVPEEHGASLELGQSSGVYSGRRVPVYMCLSKLNLTCQISIF